VLFDIKGSDIPGEPNEDMVVIFNATTKAQPMDLYAHNVVRGDWKVLVNEKKAGTTPIATVSDGKVEIAPVSAMILVK
jgi:pullulanase/glycogen debranching enzyme